MAVPGSWCDGVYSGTLSSTFEARVYSFNLDYKEAFRVSVVFIKANCMHDVPYAECVKKQLVDL